MKKIILAIFIALLSFTNLFAYDLTLKDENLIEKVEARVFDKIDDGKFTAQKVVDVIYNYTEKKRKLSPRIKEILLTIADDIEYEYSLGDYEEDDQDLGDYIDDNFSGANEEIPEDFSDDTDNSEEENIDTAEDDVDTKMVSYTISGNTISLISGEKNPKHLEIFKMFTNMIPEKFRKQIVNFKVYDNPNGGTAAFVEQLENSPEKWNLVINLDTFYIDGELDFKESIHTLIHEFAHTLTLGQTQVDYKKLNTCDNYLLGEGCLNKNAYLNKFIAKFWAKDFNASQGDEENDFYTGNEDNFVTDYAATNPGEDIAETFVFFVLHNKPTDLTKISNQKIAFFYQFKELVKLRNSIRKGLMK